VVEKLPEDDWDSHWTRYAASASENPAQHMRHKLILNVMKSFPWPTQRLLDVGSGQGDFLSKAIRIGVSQSYAGFELSASGIVISRNKLPQAEFLQVDLYSPPPESAKFFNWATVAVCSEVIEHLDEPVAFLQSLRAYLAEEAVLILTVPGGPMSAFDRHIGHRRHYSDSLIRQTLAQAGYSIEKVWLAGFPFFNLYRLLIIARGRQLVADVQQSRKNGAVSSKLACFFMSAFQLAFKFNLRAFPLGWQVVAIARKGKP
jgi:SAM-dependent methyltransferase